MLMSADLRPSRSSRSGCVMVRVVIFDVDDTLIDFRGAVAAGFRDYLADVAPDIAASDGDEARAHWDRLGDRYFARYLAGELTFPEQRRHRTLAFCADYQIVIDPGD